MNDEDKKLDEMLRQATADGSRLAPDADAELKQLQSTWREFARLLDDCETTVDSAGVVLSVGRRAARRRRQWLGMLATAAALLVAVGLGWRAWEARNNQPGAAPLNQTPIVRNEHTPATPDKTEFVQTPAAQGSSAAPANGSTADNSVADNSTAENADNWDAGLDTQIAQLDQQVKSGLTITSYVDPQIEAADQQLRSLERQLESDTL